MVKNSYVKLVFRTLFFGVMLAGALLSLGLISEELNWYVYYTNYSNYLCALVVLFEIIFGLVNVSSKNNKKQHDVLPSIKFSVLIAITVTFLVTNILLKNPFDPDYWTSASNVFMHMVNPILFWLDWLLFSEHHNTKWYYPLLELIFPLVYVAFILIRGYFIASTAPSWVTVYPYFFLNVTELGYEGVAIWVASLVAIFLVLGYLMFIFDNIPNFKKRKEKKSKKQKSKEQTPVTIIFTEKTQKTNENTEK